MPLAACAFVAGEASGDLLAAGVVRQLRVREPGLPCVGVGGDRMIAAGFEAWAHVRELSVRGYVEVLRHLPRLLALRRSLRRRLLAAPPAVFVGVDAPDFNLGLEESLREHGIRVVHYVSPSIWAWRSERIHQIRRSVDRMLLVFPFEQRIYDEAGIPATYVGHPLASMIPMVPDAGAARARLGLGASGSLVAVLPGSRTDEVRHLGPVFLDAMAQLLREDPAIRFALPVADPPLKAALQQMLKEYPGLADALTLTEGRAHDVLEAADVVLVASGTATLEAALFKRPMVIAYKMPALSAWLMRRKGEAQVPFVGLPNILAQESLVPELLQEHATAPALAAAVRAQLGDAAGRARLEQRFSAMHASLKRDTVGLVAQAILDEARR
ncbi:MAG TPA: lipid-A-disaccharide synthase [Burkholderiaceae bacterium]|nr:lipid-A-disaccharide synthase [Burkholderiaceae bacterium]